MSAESFDEVLLGHAAVAEIANLAPPDSPRDGFDLVEATRHVECLLDILDGSSPHVRPNVQPDYAAREKVAMRTAIAEWRKTSRTEPLIAAARALLPKLAPP